MSLQDGALRKISTKYLAGKKKEVNSTVQACHCKTEHCGIFQRSTQQKKKFKRIISGVQTHQTTPVMAINFELSEFYNGMIFG